MLFNFNTTGLQYWPISIWQWIHFMQMTVVHFLSWWHCILHSVKFLFVICINLGVTRLLGVCVCVSVWKQGRATGQMVLWLTVSGCYTSWHTLRSHNPSPHLSLNPSQYPTGGCGWLGRINDAQYTGVCVTVRKYDCVCVGWLYLLLDCPWLLLLRTHFDDNTNTRVVSNYT